VIFVKLQENQMLQEKMLNGRFHEIVVKSMITNFFVGCDFCEIARKSNVTKKFVDFDFYESA
jgi:hypothetical protein